MPVKQYLRNINPYFRPYQRTMADLQAIIQYLCHLMAKFAHDEVVPNRQSEQGKKEQVAEMFNSIAFRYDFLNRFLTAGVDLQWRKKAIRQLQSLQPKLVLDVATGTGDVAIMTHRMLQTDKIIGIKRCN